MERMMSQQRRSNLIRAIALSTAMIMSWAGAASAQAQSGDLQATQQALQSLQQSLSTIREQTMEANPELKQREESLQDQMMSRMRDEGVLPRKRIRRLQDMAQQMRSGEVPENEQAAMMESYQSLRQELLDARRVAMQDERIKTAQLQLQDDMVSAMTEQNAEVPSMIDRFEAMREELSAMARSQRNSSAGEQ